MSALTIFYILGFVIIIAALFYNSYTCGRTRKNIIKIIESDIERITERIQETRGTERLELIIKRYELLDEIRKMKE
jgi:hypothetical protein